MSDKRVAVILAAVALTVVAIGSGLLNVIKTTQIQSKLSSLQSSKAPHESTSSSTSGSANTSSGLNSANALPVMNQTTTVRQIRETWYLSPQAHQDRFDPSFIVVNQGDTVQLTLIDNDTVAHDFVIGPPYNILLNATVPGPINDLTGEKFTTPATNNSPGIMVTGMPGNVSATFSFVAKYTGVYEFVCTYHAQVGMIGYLVVLPNSAYGEKVSAGHQVTGPGSARVDIVSGAGSDTTINGYSPDSVTVVMGVNNTITWVNNDNAPHTVTADDGSFNSGNISPSQPFSFTFTTAGTYKYHCVYHPWMTATIIAK